jgi:hypothetical protein
MLGASLDKNGLLPQHQFTKEPVNIHVQPNLAALQQPPREAESDDILVGSAEVDGVDCSVDVFETLEALLIVSGVIVFRNEESAGNCTRGLTPTERCRVGGT